ncbi:MAG: hypothetical protein KDD52_08905 [Bdellovibrionales bacterium]|nr:hypothetical protein [Bdellovibrionales bacterium]
MPRSTVVQDQNLNSPIFDEVLDDSFFGDLDQAFTQIQIDKSGRKKSSKNKTTRKQSSTAEYAQMRKTFLSIARDYMGPVVRYVKAVEQGVVTKDITTLIEYVVSPLILTCKKTGLHDETRRLIELQRIVKKINRSQSKEITWDQTQALVEAFQPIKTTFSLTYRGHSIAVLNIVAFYKTIKVKTRKYKETDLKKLFAIGVPSLSMIRKSSIDDLVSLTGIDEEVLTDLRQEARDFTLYTFV